MKKWAAGRFYNFADLRVFGLYYNIANNKPSTAKTTAIIGIGRECGMSPTKIQP